MSHALFNILLSSSSPHVGRFSKIFTFSLPFYPESHVAKERWFVRWHLSSVSALQTLSLNICFSSDFKGAKVRGHTSRALGGLSLPLNKRTPSLLSSCYFHCFFFVVPTIDPSVLRVMSGCMIVFSQSNCHFTSGTLSSMVGHIIQHMIKSICYTFSDK